MWKFNYCSHLFANISTPPLILFSYRQVSVAVLCPSLSLSLLDIFKYFAILRLEIKFLWFKYHSRLFIIIDCNFQRFLEIEAKPVCCSNFEIERILDYFYRLSIFVKLLNLIFVFGILVFWLNTQENSVQ